MPPEVTHGFTSNSSTAVAKSGQDGPKGQLEHTAALSRQEQVQQKTAMAASAMFTLGLPPTCRSKSNCSSTTKPTNNSSKDSEQDTDTATSNADVLTAQELSQQMDTGSCALVLVDCRSFLAFNKNRVRGAVNVNCTNSFTRRRLQQGKLSLFDLATSDEGREAMRSRSDKLVVVYDQDTQAIDDLSSNHPTLLILNSLRNEGTRTTLLKGGLSDFQNQFPCMCHDEVANTAPDAPVCASPNVTVTDSDYTTARQKEIDVPATKLLSFLYVGNEKDAADLEFLQETQIDCVLNVTQSVPCFHQETTNISYKRISVRDNSLANLKKYFEESFQFIEAARKRHENVLLHCSAGISRSSTIAIAYMMKYRSMSMTNAYNFVKLRRSIIAPNLNFVSQLACYEKTIFPHQSSSVIPSHCASQIKRRTASPHPVPPTFETAL